MTAVIAFQINDLTFQQVITSTTSLAFYASELESVCYGQRSHMLTVLGVANCVVVTGNFFL